MKETANGIGTFFGSVSFVTSVLSSAPPPPVCLVHLSKCAHASPSSHAPLQTIWLEKFVFWKAQYAAVLAEGKLCYALRASPFAMSESLWLGGLILHLQNMIYYHVGSHRHTDAQTLASCLCSHSTDVFRKEQRKIWQMLALSVAESRGANVSVIFWSRAFAFCFRN